MRAQRFHVIRGTTEECLLHLGQQFDTSKQHSGVELMAQRIGVSVATVSRWLRGKHLPKGAPLVKLRYYLRSLGFTVTELEQLTGDIFSLGLLLAGNAVTVEEISIALGYQDPKSVLQILHGQQHPIGERRNALHGFIQQRAALLGGKLDVATSPVTTQEGEVPKSNGDVFLDRRSVITAAALLAAALRPLTALLVSDQCTAGDREELRKAVPGDGIFHLSRDINQLCGERARMQFANAEWRKTTKEEV